MNPEQLVTQATGASDRTHRIPPDVWSRNYWKRAHTMTPKVVG